MSQAINTLSNKREEFGKVVNGDRDLIKNLLVAVESKHSKIKDSLFKSQATALMGKIGLDVGSLGRAYGSPRNPCNPCTRWRTMC